MGAMLGAILIFQVDPTIAPTPSVLGTLRLVLAPAAVLAFVPPFAIPKIPP